MFCCLLLYSIHWARLCLSKKKATNSWLQFYGITVIFYLAVQASHPAQVLQGVLGILFALVSLGNQDFLCLLADLGCLDREDRDLPFLRLLLGIL